MENRAVDRVGKTGDFERRQEKPLMLIAGSIGRQTLWGEKEWVRVTLSNRPAETRGSEATHSAFFASLFSAIHP